MLREQKKNKRQRREEERERLRKNNKIVRVKGDREQGREMRRQREGL